MEPSKEEPNKESEESEEEIEKEEFDINTLYILLYNPMKEVNLKQENSDKISFDIKTYEIKITSDLTIKDIKDKLVNNYNISLNEFKLFSKYSHLSDAVYNDRLLNPMFGMNEKKELYLYHISELYEINISFASSHYKLVIHDSMILDNIKIRFNRHFLLGLPGRRKRRAHDFIIDGIKAHGKKKAAFYNLRKAKSIILEYIVLKG